MVVIREGRRAEVRERAITPVSSKNMGTNDIGGRRRLVPALGSCVPRRLVAPKLRPDICCLVPAPDGVAMDMMRVGVLYTRYNGV